MNICFFVSSMNLAGGTEKMVSLISNGLSKDNNVYILSIYSGSNPFFKINNNIVLYEIYNQKKSLIFNFFNIAKFVRNFVCNNDIDVFIDVDTTLSLFSLIGLIGLNVKHISWEHFNYNVFRANKKRLLARRLASRYCDYVITLTEKDKNMWLENEDCKANICCINNPIPYKKMEDDNFIYDVNSKTVLSIGRFVEQKGFDLLIEAWSLIHNRVPDWNLKIIGSGKDQKLLVDLISKYNLSDSVLIIPPTKDIESHYKSASIYCMSSRFEGLPMVLLEATFYKIPIISFDCDTGPSEIIDHNINGLLCEPLNVKELAENLYLLMSNKNLRKDFSDKSSSIISKFSLDLILEQWNKIIES